jgi:nucleotide-binding universal stress UspA family protein
MKVKHTLFPIDFSNHSRLLNRQVALLAAYFDARVTLLHVFEIPTAWYGTMEAPLINNECFTAFVDDARQRLSDYQIAVPENRVARVLAEGNAASQIANYVKHNAVDLVAMGTHGHGALGRLLLGSVTMKVLQDVECPVWTYHEGPEPSAEATKKPVSNIVCSLELTSEAVPLLRFTNDLANTFGAEVQIVHVVPGMTSKPNKYFDAEFQANLMVASGAEIADLQRSAGTAFRLTVSDGSIPQDVAAFSRTQHADLIVIGRGKVSRPLGSFRTHAHEIIRYAHCPVLSYSAEQQISSVLPAEQLPAEQVAH